MCKKEWVNIKTGRILNESGLIELKDNRMIKVDNYLWEIWDFEKNDELGFDIYQLSKSSHDKPWWICKKCDSKYDCSVANKRKGKGCPYCAKSNKRVLKGFNDMATTRPYMASMLLNAEDGYKYTESSTKILKWKCPNCENIIHKPPYEVKMHRLVCHNCRDSMSFSEKILYQLFKLNSIDFEYDKTFEFSGKCRYDFVVNNLVIELHGEQHYRDTGFSVLGGRTLEQERENDKKKRQLAEKNGYIYYEIDCRKRDFEYIINSLESHGLIELFNIDRSTFKDVDFNHSLVSECWKLHFEQGKSTKEISEILKISKELARRNIKIKKDMEKLG